MQAVSTTAKSVKSGFTAGAAALAIGCVLLPMLSASASANPDLRAKRAQARAVLLQVRALDEQVAVAAERWNGANLRLSALGAELRTTRANLRQARAGYRVSRQRAAERLVELYVSGPPDSAMAILLGAASLSEVIDALEARDRIVDQDALIARQLKTYRDTVAAQEQRLVRAKRDQEAVVERLADERAAIESRLDQRRRLLASAQAEVRRLEQAERARQVELRRRAVEELQRRRRAAAVAKARPAKAEVRPAQETGPAAIPSPPPAVAPQADAPAPTSTGSRGLQVVAIAMRYLGVPYKWGGASPATGFDCSGLTMYVFAQIGVSLPHYAAAQYGMGIPVTKEQLEPGDLVFFRGLSHMGMYIGGGNFIHAPQTGDVVKISSLSEPYRVANWVGARRVL
jgi:cell wall-associated NlpC family hydrolase